MLLSTYFAEWFLVTTRGQVSGTHDSTNHQLHHVSVLHPEVARHEEQVRHVRHLKRERPPLPVVRHERHLPTGTGSLREELEAERPLAIHVHSGESPNQDLACD